MKVQITLNPDGDLIIWLAEVKDSNYGPVEWCDSGLAASENDAIKAATDSAMTYHKALQEVQ